MAPSFAGGTGVPKPPLLQRISSRQWVAIDVGVTALFLAGGLARVAAGDTPGGRTPDAVLVARALAATLPLPLRRVRPVPVLACVSLVRALALALATPCHDRRGRRPTREVVPEPAREGVRRHLEHPARPHPEFTPASPEALALHVDDYDLGICRLEPGVPVPAGAAEARWASVTRTADELSIVCPLAQVPDGTPVSGP
ncbi:MAG: hypothetical protein ACYCXA_00145 [Actinomycetes bacterium]